MTDFSILLCYLLPLQRNGKNMYFYDERFSLLRKVYIIHLVIYFFRCLFPQMKTAQLIFPALIADTVRILFSFLGFSVYHSKFSELFEIFILCVCICM